ncbi:MAG: GTPase HflX, partial [Chloroflexi bacterium]|nr:GTPase HflX [Chloroflexota bacterium]
MTGVEIKGRRSLWRGCDSLDELAELARSAGARVVGSLMQRLDKPTQAYLGKGKIAEL